MEMDKSAAVTGGHVLVFPLPIQGHLNPMLQFSKRLASKGLRVSLITAASKPMSVQVQDQDQDQPSSIHTEPVSDGFRKGEQAANPDEYMERFNSTVPQGLADIIKRYSTTQWPAKCLIYDSVIPWGLDVAHNSGIPGAPFFTQSCAVTVTYYHALQGLLKCPLEEPVAKLPSLPEMELNDLPPFVHSPGPYPSVYHMVFSQLSNIHKANWLLWNTFDGIEDEVVNWIASKWPIKSIGPTIPSMFLDKRLEGDKDYGLSLFQPKAETCREWLDSKAPGSVVYVSFGSLASLGDHGMAELAWGLKRSNFSFLWVVRESEEKKLPSNFIEETSDASLIVTWSPQLHVLAHRSTGCFITHCGWNSTLEALSLGVPMVAMPQWTDQPTNAKFVADVWRVGVRAKVDDNGIVTKEEIERCVREVMVEGERAREIRQNSKKWKELARKAVDEGGTSDKNIDEFIRELLSDSK